MNIDGHFPRWGVGGAEAERTAEAILDLFIEGIASRPLILAVIPGSEANPESRDSGFCFARPGMTAANQSHPRSRTGKFIACS